MPPRIGLIFLCLLLLSCLVTPLWLPTLHDDPTVQHIQDRGHGDSGIHGDVQDSRDAEYQNQTLGISPGKRSLHPAGSADEWNQLTIQGRVLLGKMLSDDVNAERSQFEARADLKFWGWTQHDIPQADYVATHISGLDRLRGVENIDTSRAISTVDSTSLQHWKATRTVQDKQYFLSKDGRHHSPSGATYGAIYNPRARVISWTENYPPRKAAPQMSEEDLLTLRDFSDVGFLTYCQFGRHIKLGPASPGAAQPVAWFHIPYVKYDQTTLSAVTTVLNKLGHQGSFPDSPVSVPIGTDAFNALLATPIISQMADINIRHKHWFTTCAITSITIYNSWVQTKGSQAGHIAPGFLVHTAKVDEALERLRSENEEYERQNAALGRYDWPHRIKPMTHQGGRNAWEVWQSPPRPLPGQTGQVAAVAGPSSQGQSLSRRGDQSIERIAEASGADDLNATASSTSLGQRMEDETQQQRNQLFIEGGQLLEAMLGDETYFPAQAQMFSMRTLQAIPLRWRISIKSEPNLEALQFLQGYTSVEGLLDDGYGTGFGHNAVNVADPTQWRESEDIKNVAGLDIAYHTLVSFHSSVVARLEANFPYSQWLDTNAGQGMPSTQHVPGRASGPCDWGDLALAHTYVRTVPGKNTPPKWWPIMKSETGAASPQAEQVIEDFLKRYNLDSIPQWPGVTIPIGSYEHTQLLETPEIKQIVWSLITRKRQLGNSVVASITVFDSNPASTGSKTNQPSDRRLNFVAYVHRETARLQDAVTKNREFENGGGQAFVAKHGSQASGPITSKDGPNWPYPLRPVKGAVTPTTDRKDRGKRPKQGSGSGSSSKGKGKDSQPDPGRGGSGVVPA